MPSQLLSAVKARLRDTRAYRTARELKGALERALSPQQPPQAKVVSLQPEGSILGNVLISYILDPFLLRDGQPVSTAHTHDWESLQIARTFLEIGYAVDVISYKDQEFMPRKEYSVFIDARRNLERLSPVLPQACRRILHIDAAHMLFHNAAEAWRLLELQRRRGVTLRPRRWEMPNLGIEHADCATVLGNEFTMSTFRYANKPLYRVPISTHRLYDWPEGKDFQRCRNRYVWFGSGGLVHKGLDLVLEAFAAMPEFSLIVCGPISAERDFEQAFHRELYGMPNVYTAGWVELESQQFNEILNSCLAIVYPSCSEGGGGSVINCMHAGLIPVVSREASVDVSEDYGVVLRESSIGEIQGMVRELSARPLEQLRAMARGSWEFVRANHTRQRFAARYREVITEILSSSLQNTTK